MLPTSEQTGRHLEGNSRLVVIHNAGHAVNLEKPTEVCKSIIDFFQEPVAEDSNDEMVRQPRASSASETFLIHVDVVDPETT
jgi:hypothetical protein